MTKDQVQRLFLIGEKTTSSRGTSNEKGNGLGLILCKEFVVANRGEIGVKSVADEGSHFWFTLPLGEKPPEQALQSPEQFSFARYSALLVDDNLLNIQTSSLAT